MLLLVHLSYMALNGTEHVVSKCHSHYKNCTDIFTQRMLCNSEWKIKSCAGMKLLLDKSGTVIVYCSFPDSVWVGGGGVFILRCVRVLADPERPWYCDVTINSRTDLWAPLFGCVRMRVGFSVVRGPILMGHWGDRTPCRISAGRDRA